MAHIQDDFNASGAKDSVFDWGYSHDSVRSKSNGSARSSNDDSSKNSIGSATTGPSSRYDPSAMSRIVDITDLVDDSDDDADSDVEDDVIRHAKNQKRKSKKTRQKFKKQNPSFSYKSPLDCRQVLILTALVGIIVAASVAIGYAVLNSDNPSSSSTNGGSTGGVPPTRLGEGQEGVARQQQAGDGQQELLEIAETVIEACSEANLDEDMSECQSLCHASMCCFDEEGSEYGCEDEDDVDCAVYGGCQALLVGLSMEDGEEE